MVRLGSYFAFLGSIYVAVHWAFQLRDRPGNRLAVEHAWRIDAVGMNVELRFQPSVLVVPGGQSQREGVSESSCALPLAAIGATHEHRTG